MPPAVVVTVLLKLGVPLSAVVPASIVPPVDEITIGYVGCIPVRVSNPVLYGVETAALVTVIPSPHGVSGVVSYIVAYIKKYPIPVPIFTVTCVLVPYEAPAVPLTLTNNCPLLSVVYTPLDDINDALDAATLVVPAP